MEKEKFIEERVRIQVKLKNLRNELEKLENQYIESNKKFDVDQKVKVMDGRGGEEIGFVVGFEIGYNNNVNPKLVKCKKDGSPSQIKLFVWSNSVVEPLN